MGSVFEGFMKPGHSQFDSVDDSPLKGFIGHSPAMANVYQLARISALSNSCVLLHGETGTGKGRIATALHQLSQRSNGPMVRVNCGMLTDDQLHIVLFGEPDWPCSNPDGSRSGRFEEARGGTLFLDEINSTSSTLQARLLHVLQEGCIERSSGESIDIDVRVVAACSLDLNLEVSEGRFREDLYWRLNVIPIAIPPLRRREGDVELLVNYFVGIYSQAIEKPIRSIAPDALKALVNYQWPGNIRELQNYIERAVVLAQSDQIESSIFPTSVMGDAQAAQVAVFRPTDDESLIREFVYSRLSKSENDASDLMKQIVEPVEKELLEQVMKRCNQTQTTAAKKLGMNRNTLYRKLVDYGLAKPKSGGSLKKRV